VRAARRAGPREIDERPLVFRPHDMRPIFATEDGGLRCISRQELLGHLDLNTTEVYVDVYDDQVVRHVQAYVARRRATRPSEEYREPTRSEWGRV
jgi:integrase